MIVQRKLILNLLAQRAGAAGDERTDEQTAQRARELLPALFDAEEYRAELRALGVEPADLTMVNDPGPDDPRRAGLI